MTQTPELICSAKGCRAEGVHAIRWNNPKIHTPERRKVWLACAEHLERLEKFLQLRGFHRDTVATADLPTDSDTP